MWKEQVEIWKTDNVWNLIISESGLFRKWKATEEQLTELQSKRQKLQKEVDTLTKKSTKASKRNYSSKIWKSSITLSSKTMV